MSPRITIFAWLIAAACGADKTADTAQPPAQAREAPAAQCPSAPIESKALPDVDPEHRQLSTWVAKVGPEAADAVLVEPEQIADLNAASSAIHGAWRDPTSPQAVASETIDADLAERLSYMRERVATGEMVETRTGSLSQAAEIVGKATPLDQFRLVREELALYCVPLQDGLFKVPVDEAFDRNRCASLHPGELVRVIRRADAGRWLYVHAGHTVGWVHEPVLTRRLSRDDVDRWQRGPRLVSLRDDVEFSDGFVLRLGVSLPIVRRDDDGFHVLIPGVQGLEETVIDRDAPVHEGYVPLSREAVWDVALSELEAPYGWGGRGGERDCSRFLRDVFASFGLQLARHSGVQAQLGTHNVDVAGMADADKLAAIEQWASRGLVILYMPGHVMLYLGRDAEHHYGVSSMSEYLVPCPGGADTTYKVDRVVVSTLEVGRGTERTAFVERITRLVVFAPTDDRQSAAGPVRG